MSVNLLGALLKNSCLCITLNVALKADACMAPMKAAKQFPLQTRGHHYYKSQQSCCQGGLRVHVCEAHACSGIVLAACNWARWTPLRHAIWQETAKLPGYAQLMWEV